MTLPTISNIAQTIAGGFDRADFYALSPEGYALGQSPTLAQGVVGSFPYRLLAGKTANIAIPKPDVQYAVGDDIVYGSLLFQAATLPNFELAVAVQDMIFQSLTQSLATYLMGNIRMALLQPSAFNLIDLAGIFQRRAKVQGGLINNASAWQGVIIPKVNVYPLGTKDITERKIAEDGYWVIANPSDILPNGLDIPTAFAAVTTAPVIPFTSPNRMAIASWVADGTATVYTLAKNKMTLIDGTLNTGPTSGGRNTVTNNGILVVSGLTIVTSTDPQTYTFSVAPLAGHVINSWSEELS